MSQLNHLKRAVKILRDAYENEIAEHGDWYYNLKHWTINFVENQYEESVVAYKVKQNNNLTDWSDYVIIEKRVSKWVTVV